MSKSIGTPIGTAFLKEVDASKINSDLFVTVASFLILLEPVTLEELKEFLAGQGEDPAVAEKLRLLISKRLRTETVSFNGTLTIPALLAHDKLVDREGEVYEVEKLLGKTSVCRENEISFRLSSVGHRNMKTILVRRRADGKLEILGFKKHLPRTEL